MTRWNFIDRKKIFRFQNSGRNLPTEYETNNNNQIRYIRASHASMFPSSPGMDVCTYIINLGAVYVGPFIARTELVMYEIGEEMVH